MSNKLTIRQALTSLSKKEEQIDSIMNNQLLYSQCEDYLDEKIKKISSETRSIISSCKEFLTSTNEPPKKKTNVSFVSSYN